MAKATYVLDDETLRAIRTLAARQQKSQSHVVREAIAAYARREEKLTDAERARKLDLLDDLRARPRTRPPAAVDAELREIRRRRRDGWRRPSD
jgi:hypothetical protein